VTGLSRASVRELEDELARLKKLLGLNDDLRVLWRPGADTVKLGEVKGKLILIYAEDLDKAIETVDHEVIDYVVSGAVDPYRQMVNSLIRTLNDGAYRRKEEAVEMLRRMAKAEARD
jgi:hypothetical protein